MVTATPPGGWAAASAHWNAIGKLAATAVATAKAKGVLMEDKPCEQCRMKDSRFTYMEEQVSKLNTTIEDQAARIVSLQGRLDLRSPTGAREIDTIKELQKRDETMRRNLERAEARCIQIMNWAIEHELVLPNEAAYYSNPIGGTDPTSPAS